MSKSTLTELDPGPGLEAWLRSWNVASRVAAIVIHNTESPTGSQYKGVSTIEGIRRYHMETRGWKDIGANLYTTPRGTVVTGRPLDESNWSHAVVSRPWSDVEAEAKALCGGDRNWPNHHALGIETVANFDQADPWGDNPDARSLQATLACCVTICRVFSLDPLKRILIHRDVADKSCPGRQLDRAAIRAELDRRLRGETMPVDIDTWAVPWVERAIDEGLMSRGADGKFRGRDPVTRQETAIVAVRLIDKLRQEMRQPGR